MFAPAHSRGDLRLLAAVSPDGAREVWVSRTEGLFAIDRGPQPRRTALGDGHSPRFASDGRLVFERGRDDGHHMLSEETRVLDPDAHAARLAFPDEVLPDYGATAPAHGADAPVKLCIDPGHGGTDPGAIGFGLREADVVLGVARLYGPITQPIASLSTCPVAIESRPHIWAFTQVPMFPRKAAGLF